MVAEVGDAEGSVHWFEQMVAAGVDPNELHYQTVVSAVVDAANMGQADSEEMLSRVIATAETPRQRKQRYDLIVRGCAEAGDVRLAEEWFEKMQSQGFRATLATLEIAAGACMEAGLEDRILWWLEKAPTKGANVTLQGRLGAFVRRHILESVDRIDKAALGRVAGWILRLSLSAELPASEVPYERLIQAYAYVGMPADAAEWLEEMVEHGRAPSLETFNALILCLSRGRDPEAAALWLERAMRMGVEPDEESYLSVPGHLFEDRYFVI